MCVIGEPLNIDHSHSNWFSSFVSCKLGNGRSLDFWRHTWIGSYSFEILFPSLFCLWGSFCNRVCDVGVWINDTWKWDLGLRGVVLSVEDSLWFEELLGFLYDVKPNVSKEDKFVWWRDKFGFSVKASYKRILEASVMVPSVDPSLHQALDRLWLSKVLSKVFIFGWHLLLNRLPPRLELAKRGIIDGPHNVVFPLCFLEEEDVEHLFGSCFFL